MSSFATYAQTNSNHDIDPRFENIPEEEMIRQDYINNETSQQQQTSGKKFRLRISQRLHWTAVLAFLSYLILLTSFASPYWLSSYKFTDSAFKRLGLWDFCFLDYRHPSYQYDTKFTGCHWIFSPVYTNIRDWLQPPWFMFVQAVVTIALCVSSLGLLIISVIFMHFLIQYQLIILCLSLLCHMLTTLLLAFGLVIFYLKAFDRTWIMYPQFNHVDWAFFFALVSMAGNGFASYLYYEEMKELKGRMLKMKRLIVATPNGRSFNGGLGSTGDDIDSVDQVYATRSVTSYNQQSMMHDNQDGRAQHTTTKSSSLMYPHFTQV